MGATQSISEPYILETSKGKLQGIQQFDKHNPSRTVLRRFLRVPYAQSPVGPLRWRRPQPLSEDYSFTSPSGQPGNFSSFGPICPQPYYPLDAMLLPPPEGVAPEVENVQDEDCLYVNIWVPAAEPSPPGGWPVQLHLHGGWLQMGNANQSNEGDPFDLLKNSTPRIIVVPTYRLNLFGFLAGEELSRATEDPFAGNFGLWDQRMAIEWTAENIHLFGGNASKLTVGGLSAGAHSTFLQLYFDSHLPVEKRLIRQIYLRSNALMVQPNPTTSEKLTQQFRDLCAVTGVSNNLSAKEKIDELRKVPATTLIDAISKLSLHTFRTSTDGPFDAGGFMPPSFLKDLTDGSFTTKLARHGVRIMMGEVKDEKELYRVVNPPHSRDSLLVQVGNYYPPHVVDALVRLPLYNVPAMDSGLTKEGWGDLFAQMVADCQVYVPERGNVKCFLQPPAGPGVDRMPSANVFRFRVDWRAKSFDQFAKPECGVYHGADSPIFWGSGYRAGYTKDEEAMVEQFLKPFGQFLNFETTIDWVVTGSPGPIRIIHEDGKLEQGAKDADWDRCLEIWDAVLESQKDLLH